MTRAISPACARLDMVEKAMRYRDVTPLGRIEMGIVNAQSFALYTGSAEAQERVRDLSGARPNCWRPSRFAGAVSSRFIRSRRSGQAGGFSPLRATDPLDLGIVDDLQPDLGRIVIRVEASVTGWAGVQPHQPGAPHRDRQHSVHSGDVPGFGVRPRLRPEARRTEKSICRTCSSGSITTS
jgi:hypothetical protein